MTPDLEQRLRDHLAAEAAGLDPITEPAERAMLSHAKHARIRRAVAAGGVVAALAIGIPAAIAAAGSDGVRPDSGSTVVPTATPVPATSSPAPATPVETASPPPVTLASPPAAALQWLYRGTGSNGKPVERDAYRAWAVAHRVSENQLGGVDLFEVAPAPGTLVLLFSIDNNIDAWTGIYVEDHTSQRLVYDTPADNTKPIVAQLLVDGAPYTLIVADPKTPVITFASDGVNFAPVTKSPSTQVGKAWALIPGPAANGRVGVASCATCPPIEVATTVAH